MNVNRPQGIGQTVSTAIASVRTPDASQSSTTIDTNPPGQVSDTFQRISGELRTELHTAEVQHQGQALLEAIDMQNLEQVQSLLAEMPKNLLNDVLTQPHLFTDHRIAREFEHIDDLNNPETLVRVSNTLVSRFPSDAFRPWIQLINLIQEGIGDNIREAALHSLASDNVEKRAAIINQATLPKELTVLTMAAETGNLAVVTALLTAAQDDNQRVRMVTQANGEGCRPLDIAIFTNQLEIVQAILGAVPKSQLATVYDTVPKALSTAILKASSSVLACVLKTIPKEQLIDRINQSMSEKHPILAIQALKNILVKLSPLAQQRNQQAAMLMWDVYVKAGLLMAYGAEIPPQIPAGFQEVAASEVLKTHGPGVINDFSGRLTNPDAMPAEVQHAVKRLQWVMEQVDNQPETERKQCYQPVREQFNQFLQGQIRKLGKTFEQPGQRQAAIALLERTRPLLKFQEQGIQCDAEKLDALGAAAVRANYLAFLPGLIEAGAAWQETGREVAQASKSEQKASTATGNMDIDGLETKTTSFKKRRLSIQKTASSSL